MGRGARDAMLAGEEGSSLSLPPPLWGRVGERGSPGRDGGSWLPLSLPIPHKGGGNERAVAASRSSSLRKFPNGFKQVLLCMGLFSCLLSDGTPA
jgi:hypothetical protein